MQSTRDPHYETTRIESMSDFWKKMRWKRFLYRLFGEIYIGKRVKLAYFKRLLRDFTLEDGSTLVELGSGDGVFCYYAASALPRCGIVGLELNSIEAAVCQEVAKEERFANLEFRNSKLSDIEQSGRIDVIFCLDVLEHIEEDVEVLSEMRKAVKVGGRVLIHVPNRFYRESNGEMRTVADEEAWTINPGHVRAGYTPEELKEKLSMAGFKVFETKATQGIWIAYAYHLYRAVERFIPLRVAILPILDLLTWLDMRSTPKHGNTVWAIATRDS